MDVIARAPMEILCLPFLLPLISGVLACGGLPDEQPKQTEMAASALTSQDAFTPNQLDFSSGSCSDSQQGAIKQALAILHAQFIATPQPMIDCLKEAIFAGPFVNFERTGDHAEWVVDKMTRTAPTVSTEGVPET